jgi:hypothetical protein
MRGWGIRLRERKRAGTASLNHISHHLGQRLYSNLTGALHARRKRRSYGLDRLALRVGGGHLDRADVAGGVSGTLEQGHEGQEDEKEHGYSKQQYSMPLTRLLCAKLRRAAFASWRCMVTCWAGDEGPHAPGGWILYQWYYSIEQHDHLKQGNGLPHPAAARHRRVRSQAAFARAPAPILWDKNHRTHSSSGKAKESCK